MYFQVIMPVGADPRRQDKEAIVRRAAEARGLSIHLPRYASKHPVFNLQASLQDLRGAEFVVADLSLERPSCYYELGLAEALGKPVYLIAEQQTTIHQTAARRFVRFFGSLDEFEELIEGILDQAVEGEEAANPP